MILPAPTLVNIRSEPHEIYIGLGSPWGNPYVNTMSRGAAIKAYEKRLRRFMEEPGWRVELKALAGKTLGCHCRPLSCHGDVIIRIFLEFYGPEGTMIVGGPNALGTAIRGMGPESQFHRSLHREPIRGAVVPVEREQVDLGSIRARQSWASGQSRASEEDGGERS